MSEFVLAVFFFVNGSWVSLPDFPAFPMESESQCQERRDNAQEYFDSLQGFYDTEVLCLRALVGEPA